MGRAQGAAATPSRPRTRWCRRARRTGRAAPASTVCCDAGSFRLRLLRLKQVEPCLGCFKLALQIDALCSRAHADLHLLNELLGERLFGRRLLRLLRERGRCQQQHECETFQHTVTIPLTTRVLAPLTPDEQSTPVDAPTL